MNYNNTSENVECPICMECILDTKNKVTTECGHCFHTNCLMTSVAHNGFGCPYCRTAMAEAVDDDDDDDDGFDDSDWATSNSDEDDDRALRGFRFMFNGLAGESNDPEDNLEEDEDDEEELHNDHVENTLDAAQLDDPKDEDYVYESDEDEEFDDDFDDEGESDDDASEEDEEDDREDYDDDEDYVYESDEEDELEYNYDFLGKKPTFSRAIKAN